MSERDIRAELAACNRLLAPREREVFHLVAGHLGLDAAAAARMLENTLTVPASGVLGLEPVADVARIDAAFLDRVQPYNPAKIGELGPEFAALAVRRLEVITDAYEVAIAGAD